jgi:DNA invertase Pin-like site-specific DNA recombinase
MVSTAFAGIADFERSLIVERTSAGRIAAKARGVRFGPSPALSAAQIENARKLIKDEEKKGPRSLGSWVCIVRPFIGR